MKKIFVIFLAMLVSLSLACNLTSSAPTSTGPGQGNGAIPPGGNGGGASAPTDTPTPTPIPSTPLGFLAGLGSLDSYTLVIESNSQGPTAADSSQLHVDMQASKSQDAKMVHYKSLVTSADSSGATPTDNYEYTVGNKNCTGNDSDGWNATEITPQTAEMENVVRGLMDFTLVVDNPTFVGVEAMNGVATNHFTFQVSGLGLQSGAQVNANQGDYWLAQDGQYVVRYKLVTETQDPNTQTVLHSDLLIDLTNINQPVDISLPSGCNK